MHPFSRARERTRALNAAKMERMFAKPFVAGLEGHVDAVEVLMRKPGDLSTVASGSWDGGTLSLCYVRNCLQVHHRNNYPQHLHENPFATTAASS